MIPGDFNYSKYYETYDKFTWTNKKDKVILAYTYVVLYFYVFQNIFNVCNLGYIILFLD